MRSKAGFQSAVQIHIEEGAARRAAARLRPRPCPATPATSPRLFSVCGWSATAHKVFYEGIFTAVSVALLCFFFLFFSLLSGKFVSFFSRYYYLLTTKRVHFLCCVEHFLPFECVTFASSFSSCFSFLEGSFVPGKKKSRQHFMECFNSHFCSEPFFLVSVFLLGHLWVLLRSF